MTSAQWKPSASIVALKERAKLLRNVRNYFDSHGVMEVETPILSSGATADVHIDSFSTEFSSIGDGKKQACYLHTSPEFAMKRLLAAGSGDIFSLGKVFRNGEVGDKHNPEFTMLEWYRVGMDQHLLMDDVVNLLSEVASFTQIRRCSYGEIFEEVVGVNPHIVSDDDLGRLVQEKVYSKLAGLDRVDCLDLLFSNFIEPQLGGPSTDLKGVFVYDYPACMSSLARLHTNDNGGVVAARFELFVNGVELANGYHELLDADEQKVRFEALHKQRQAREFDVYPYDQRLVAALAHGMPDCAGVAIGVDRLLMLMMRASCINDVLAFDFGRA